MRLLLGTGLLAARLALPAAAATPSGRIVFTRDAYLTLEPDGSELAAVFCPACAEAEFGD